MRKGAVCAAVGLFPLSTLIRHNFDIIHELFVDVSSKLPDNSFRFTGTRGEQPIFLTQGNGGAL
jgi:hypothetical protein